VLGLAEKALSEMVRLVVEESDRSDDRAVHVAELEEAIELDLGTRATVDNAPAGAVRGRGGHEGGAT